MKSFICIITFLAHALFVTAQTQAQNEKTIDDLLQNGKFEEVIQQFATGRQQLSPRSLFGIGCAYHNLGKPPEALKWTDSALAQDPEQRKAHFVRGYSLQMLKRYPEAEISLKKELEQDPSNGDALLSLGDTYTAQEKYQEALETYTAATKVPEPVPEAFVMIGQIYYETGQTDKALEAFYIARGQIKGNDELRNNTVSSIGQLELQAGRPEKALPMFLEVLQAMPGTLNMHSKIIQCYYAQKSYDKAMPYIREMYEAHKQGRLQDEANDEFCIHQFEHNNKRIFVYERFQVPPSDKIFNKHIFYVMDENLKLEWKLQTEYSPIAVELGSVPYVLCGWKGNTHLNFNTWFPADYKFDDVKAAVIAELNKPNK